MGQILFPNWSGKTPEHLIMPKVEKACRYLFGEPTKVGDVRDKELHKSVKVPRPFMRPAAHTRVNNTFTK